MIAIALGALVGLGGVLIVVSMVFPHTTILPKRTTQGRLARELRTRLSLSGLGMVPVPAFIVACVLLAGVAGGIVQAMFGIVVLTLLAALGGALTPLLIVTWRARATRRTHRMLWPDVVDHLVSSIRAGTALPEAVAQLADAGPDALRASFRGFARDYRTSASFGGALDRLKNDLGDPVADRIIETLKMARDVGGTELPGVLRSLSAAIREDSGIRSEVDARQSWVRNAAKLGVAAPWLILFLLASRPEAAAAYNSPIGITVIVAGAVVSVVAYRFMLALGRLPEERRWFR
ncbi:type II secretion system F family protein [Paramicrobacterium agarici]|uniref:Tight adherence protein B n=1 Tax=Paramicrobacterium agarici TaxID=630514 RepID=A0A2A9DZ52_9MICO|nr:type II secretion system protein F [Microbacterium agarici]PFG31601.1 tight adherence protein B [Microbacterium agarici]